MTRVEWVSGIYHDMTGELPPESFWETPSGQEIMENNPAWLYDQPTANLYQIIRELPPERYSELLQRIRARQPDAHSDDEGLLIKAITESAFRFYSRNPSRFHERERYPKAATPEHKARQRKIMRKRSSSSS